jgi:hypothetical protein
VLRKPRRLDRLPARHHIQRLTVAGPRASEDPAPGAFARVVLDASQRMAAG